MSSRVLSYVRQPEYTGPNRCLPCTVVNVGIAVAIGLAIGWLWPVAGVGFFVFALAAIALRGYFVPGTPELTKRYLPDRIHRWFGHGPDPNAGDGGELERTLVEWGVLEPCADVDDLCLRDEVRAAYQERLAAVDVDGIDPEALTPMFDAEPRTIEIRRTSAPLVRVRGDGSTRWPSWAALRADVAMEGVLRDRVDDWVRTDPQARGPLLAGLRPFLEACPACEGPLAFGEEVVSSCCREHDVVQLSCEACDATIFEVEAPQLEAVQEN